MNYFGTKRRINTEGKYISTYYQKRKISSKVRLDYSFPAALSRRVSPEILDKTFKTKLQICSKAITIEDITSVVNFRTSEDPYAKATQFTVGIISYPAEIKKELKKIEGLTFIKE